MKLKDIGTQHTDYLSQFPISITNLIVLKLIFQTMHVVLVCLLNIYDTLNKHVRADS